MSSLLETLPFRHDYMVLSQSTHVSDRQTDRQTDGQTDGQNCDIANTTLA